jgi:CheY-like chemotaxis protein
MKTVLVIDDDVFILVTVGDVLRNAGYTVLTVQTPEEAFDLDLSGVSAILCDYNMPRMDGTEVLIAMRELKQCHAPFIFLTGHEVLEDLLSVAIRYDAELLPKPIDPAELTRMLQKQIAAAA